MLEAIRQDDWIGRKKHFSRLDLAVAALIEADLSFDALVFNRHLPYLRTFALRYPELRIVIDHAAKPPLRGSRAELRKWFDWIEIIARLPNVHCKLSGLTREAGPELGRSRCCAPLSITCWISSGRLGYDVGAVIGRYLT